MESLADDVSTTDADAQSTPDRGPPDATPEFAVEFDIEVGTTYVTDEATGRMRSLWVAELTDAETAERAYGEHPADAVLGVIEKATGGDV